jgi:hypothetical protein
MGAALAYYMALSLAPSLVIVLAIAGFAFQSEGRGGRDALALPVPIQRLISQRFLRSPTASGRTRCAIPSIDRSSINSP